MARQWWQGAVIYQIYPRSFRDLSGDGIGDLPGVIEKLPYVASLGVDAIWLSPVFRSPMKDFGYDIEDHSDIDPLFGTLADADRLIARAHQLGLKVVFDMVWAHTADTHPWFRSSRRSADNPLHDWYVWADPKPDGSPPNNWLAVFGGGAWSWEPRRRQYYLHHFLPSQPALNWRNQEVIETVMEVGRFWLARGVDGLRLDAVDFLLHDGDLRDNPARRLAEVPTRPFSMQDHLHDMMHEETLAALAHFRTLSARFDGKVMMGELSSSGDPVARAGSYTGEGRLDLAYSLGLMRRPATAPALKATIAEIAAKVPDGGLVWSLSNHDVERAATRWGDGSPASAKMLMALSLAMPGTVCLYQGDELGLPEAEVPSDRLVDPFGLAFWPDFKGRDGCRTPMPWTADARHCGFSEAEPWLPIPASHRPLAVQAQESDPVSVLDATRRLLRLRREHPALKAGGLTPLDFGLDLVAFERIGPSQRIICLFNPSPAAIRTAAPLPGRLVEAEACAEDRAGLRLGPWGFALVLV